MLKTHADLRRERGLAIPSKGQDSEYLRHDETVDRERDERVFAPLQVPKAIATQLPFKSKEKVKVLNDRQVEDSRRKTNLLEEMQLPTKRPFKKMFMNEQEKKIHSMVQRLSHLGKVYMKEKQEKREVHKAAVKKRAAKESEKRDAKQKEIRKARYKKQQGKANFAASKGGEE
jgi:ribosome biogenesis protein BMS1